MLVVQCEFHHDAGENESKPRIVTQTAWVDASKVKLGSKVKFKDRDDDRVWVVVRKYTTVMEIADIHQDWQVGGNTEVTARREK